jgi:aspartate dehydrogenase
MKLNVALIGCGAIGTTLARAIDDGRAGEVRLSWIYDLNREKSDALARKLRSKPRIARSASEICADKEVDLVIEAASQLAVEQYSMDILNSRKDLMVMSVGAFADQGLFKSLRKAAEKNDRSIFIPSGAILGIDGVKAAGLGKLRRVVLTTRKPPAALAYSGYLRKRGIRLKGLKHPRVVFDGPAREAVKAFPASVNVAATLSLAGIGLDKTRVRVVADPKLRRNVHEILIEGDSGELIAVAKNLPFPDSRRTSYLAALSAIRMLKNLSETIRIGT